MVSVTPPGLDGGSPTAPQRRLGRIPVSDVAPLVDNGNRPAKSVVDEEFDVTARCSARATTRSRHGRAHRPGRRASTAADGAGQRRAGRLVGHRQRATRTGRWGYRVEGWSDPYGTWEHDAVIKVGAGVDIELMLEEGARVLERAVAEVERSPEQVTLLTAAVGALRDASRTAQERLAAGVADEVRHELHERPLRDFVTPSPERPWLVERERALYGAWYEMFPRSEGAELDEGTGQWRSGTFATAARRLPRSRRWGSTWST